MSELRKTETPDTITYEGEKELAGLTLTFDKTDDGSISLHQTISAELLAATNNVKTWQDIKTQIEDDHTVSEK